MLKGLNHITVAVSDLSESFDFYVSVLGFKPEVKWKSGAYLSTGELWLCLSLDTASPAKDYSHISFSISATDFNAYCSKLVSAGVKTWKENKSEGDSFYVLDPDGHKLEIHVGNLHSRLKALRINPYDEMTWY